MERVSRETWSKRVERWKDSGLTAAEYAAEAGINAHSLSWWKWRLGSNGATPKLRIRSTKRVLQQIAAASDFRRARRA